jgi:hypothetical protein
MTISAPIDVRKAYWIASHVHIRNTMDGCVLLDLKRDKYLGLGTEETALLARIVNEWPRVPVPRDVEEGVMNAKARSAELCEALLEDGLIRLGRPAGAPDRRAQEMDQCMEWVSIGDELDLPSRVTFRDLAKFLLAFAAAWLSLRFGRLERTVETVRRSRSGARFGDAELALQGECDVPGDIFRMARAVDVFRRMRTYAFAAEGRCLLHALTLIKFLRRCGLHADWVIGVRTQPWGAHSWVQCGTYLLDTTPEKVGQYLPILVV